MTQTIGVQVRRDPWLWPVIAGVCAASIVWVAALPEDGYATRYPAVPVAFAAFLLVQLLAPRLRWSGERVLGPGNVATLLFALQLVGVPTLLVVSGPYLGSLRVVPPDQYVNTALLLQAAAYACYAIGYVAWVQPVRPKPLLLPSISNTGTANTGTSNTGTSNTGTWTASTWTTGVAATFIALGAVGLVLTFPTPGALIDYFSGHGDIFDTGGPATLSSAASTFLRPFLAYGLIILWAIRIRRRPPGARMSLAEIGMAGIALAVSATYGYNRASVVVPLLALVTAYSYFGRRQQPARLVALLVVLAGLGFAFGQYREVYSGTHGGAINPADAGLNRPGAAFGDNLQGYGNAAQFWAVIVGEVDRTGLRHGDSIVGSALYPVPVLGKPFRADSGLVRYNELIYAERGVNDQNLGLGAEMYWNFGVPGVVVGYFLLGFAVRRFDDRVEAAPDALASYSWAYCGIWVAFLVVNSISVLAQIVTYFFPPVIAMFVVASGTRTTEVTK